MIRTYSELIRMSDYMDRFNYLKLHGNVGEETFGWDRYLNQSFYSSTEWRKFRRDIILRDQGNDMACKDFPINGIIVIHHLNPISIEDIKDFNPDIMNPEYVVCVADITHKAIHYGDAELLPKGLIKRRPGDTCPWK